MPSYAPDEEVYWTVPEVAARFRVTKAAVYNWTREGLLGYVTIGKTIRIPESDVQKFIKRPGAGGRRPWYDG